jgi:hypothetical protein
MSQIFPQIRFPVTDFLVSTIEMIPTTTRDPGLKICQVVVCSPSHGKYVPAYAPASSDPPVGEAKRTAPAMGGPSRMAKLMKVSWKLTRAPTL